MTLHPESSADDRIHSDTPTNVTSDFDGGNDQSCDIVIQMSALSGRQSEQSAPGWKYAAGQTFHDGQVAIRSRLGQGGFGQVYEVDMDPALLMNGAQESVQLAMKGRVKPEVLEAVIAHIESVVKDVRHAALKVVEPKTSMVFSRLLHREVALPMGLQEDLHFIPKIYGIEQQDSDEIFLYMEYVPGVDFSDVIHANGLKPMNFFLAMNMASELSRIMAMLHKKGVIHRDLKPSNIRFRVEGDKVRVMLLDFGLGLDVESKQTRYTQEHSIAGSLEYLSPEQARGENTNLSAKTDVYSLGLILYQIFDGKIPFYKAGGTQVEIVTTKRELQPSDTQNLEFDLSRLKDPRVISYMKKDLLPMLQRMLHPDPSARPDMSEVTDYFRQHSVFSHIDLEDYTDIAYQDDLHMPLSSDAAQRDLFNPHELLRSMEEEAIARHGKSGVDFLRDHKPETAFERYVRTHRQLVRGSAYTLIGSTALIAGYAGVHYVSSSSHTTVEQSDPMDPHTGDTRLLNGKTPFHIQREEPDGQDYTQVQVGTDVYFFYRGNFLGSMLDKMNASIQPKERVTLIYSVQDALSFRGENVEVCSAPLAAPLLEKVKAKFGVEPDDSLQSRGGYIDQICIDGKYVVLSIDEEDQPEGGQKGRDLFALVNVHHQSDKQIQIFHTPEECAAAIKNLGLQDTLASADFQSVLQFDPSLKKEGHAVADALAPVADLRKRSEVVAALKTRMNRLTYAAESLRQSAERDRGAHDVAFPETDGAVTH